MIVNKENPAERRDFSFGVLFVWEILFLFNYKGYPKVDGWMDFIRSIILEFKMKLRLVIIILFVAALSCNTGNNDFEMIKSVGLDGENLHFETTLFCNSDTGFIAGGSLDVLSNPDFPLKDSSQFAFANSIAVLFRTTDGGRTWTKQEFGEGHISDVSKVKGRLYAFKRSDTSNDIVVNTSADYGSTWEESSSLPKGVYDVFSDNVYLYAIGTDSSRQVYYLYSSDNDGEHWSSGQILHYSPFNKPVPYKGKIAYLSNSKPHGYFPDFMIMYDYKDSAVEKIPLPAAFNCYFLSLSDNNIRLVGSINERIAVYSLQNDNKFRLEYEYAEASRIFPDGYFRNGNDEWIVVGKREDQFVSHKIVETKDNGSSWKTISFKDDSYVRPFYFYSEGGKVKAWFYSGSGEFQVLR